jgi:hypothetical protein
MPCSKMSSMYPQRDVRTKPSTPIPYPNPGSSFGSEISSGTDARHPSQWVLELSGDSAMYDGMGGETDWPWIV